MHGGNVNKIMDLVSGASENELRQINERLADLIRQDVTGRPSKCFAQSGAPAVPDDREAVQGYDKV